MRRAYPCAELLAELVKELRDVLIVLDPVAFHVVVAPAIRLHLRGRPRQPVIVLLGGLTQQALEDEVGVVLCERGLGRQPSLHEVSKFRGSAFIIIESVIRGNIFCQGVSASSVQCREKLGG